MIVNVYAHLVDEMRRKDAYKLPQLDFKARTEPKMLVRIACQGDKSRPTQAASPSSAG